MAGSIDRVTAAAAEAGLEIEIRRMGVSTQAFGFLRLLRSWNLITGNVAPVTTWSLAWCCLSGEHATNRYCALP